MEALGDSVSASTPASMAAPAPAVTPAVAAAARRRRSRRYHLLARLLVLCTDAVAINVAFFLAYMARYLLGLGRELADENFVEYTDYWPVQLALVALVLFFFHLRGLYNLARGAAWFDEVLSVAAGAFYGVGLLFAVISLVRYPANSRLTFVYVWVLIVLLVALGRSFIRVGRAVARRRGLGIAQVLVVGGN